MEVDGVSHVINDVFAGISGTGFRDTNAWLAFLTGNLFPAKFYADDALGSFNDLARLLTGTLTGLTAVWLLYPYVDSAMQDLTSNANKQLAGRLAGKGRQRMLTKKVYLILVLLLCGLAVSIGIVWSALQPTSPALASNPSSTDANSPSFVATASAAVTIIPAALKKQGIPAKLGTLVLTKTITGTEALADFSKLHGESFDLVGGYEAHYGKDQALLWVAQAKDTATAQTLVEEMARKIGPGNTAFTNVQALNISNQDLYSANGQGQQHFFTR